MCCSRIAHVSEKRAGVYLSRQSSRIKKCIKGSGKNSNKKSTSVGYCLLSYSCLCNIAKPEPFKWTAGQNQQTPSVYSPIPSLISVIGTEMLRVSSGDSNNEPNASVINFTTQHTRCQRLGSISICKPNLFLIIPYYSVSLLGLWDGVCQESQK